MNTLRSAQPRTYYFVEKGFSMKPPYRGLITSERCSISGTVTIGIHTDGPAPWRHVEIDVITQRTPKEWELVQKALSSNSFCLFSFQKERNRNILTSFTICKE